MIKKLFLKEMFVKFILRTLFLYFVIYSSPAFAQTSAEVWTAKNYAARSVVLHNNKCYEAKWWAGAGQQPGTNVAQTWNTPWKEINKTICSNVDNNGNSVSTNVSYTLPIWAEKNYIVGDKISYNGKCYEAKWWTEIYDAPGATVDSAWKTPWKKINGNCSNSAGSALNNGQANTYVNNLGPIYKNKRYVIGNVVYHNNKCYKAKWFASSNKEPGATVRFAWNTPWAETATDKCKKQNQNTGRSANTVANDQPSFSALTISSSLVGSSIGGGGNAGSGGNTGGGSTGGNAGGGGSTGGGNAGGNGDPNAKFYYTDQQLMAQEQAIINSTPGLRKVKDSVRTRSNTIVNAIAPLSTSNPVNVKRVESFMSERDWNFLFAKRNAKYSYLNFLKAVAKFPALCDDYSDGRNADQICRKTLATMFAHFTQETGGHAPNFAEPEWRQGLYYLREVGWTEDKSDGYAGECNPSVWQGQTWPCGTFPNGKYKSYFGRGAKQLSYNYNYGPFSQAMFGTVRTLLDNPEMVADTWLNLASAIFFYLYPQPPKPSMLHVIDGTWKPNAHDRAGGLVPGFGVTIQIINGGVECGGSDDLAQGKNRIKYYREFAKHFNIQIPSDEVLGCAGMKQFDTAGSGALFTSWEQDYGYIAANPGGKTYACKLVGYQTRFSVFIENDYTKCVKFFFK